VLPQFRTLATVMEITIYYLCFLIFPVIGVVDEQHVTDEVILISTTGVGRSARTARKNPLWLAVYKLRYESAGAR
jgi:hypothetical protein